ncbi:hypothetical protein Gogos_019701, partial [Gossypium gossypioides]|nr:hypothetical protein [Gossypium gossypioides]
MGDLKEKIDDVDDGLQTMQEQLREFVWDTIGSSENKLIEKDDALEAMVAALKEEINELKGKLKIFKAAIGNGMLASKLKPQVMDVPKPKAFKGARSVSEVDNFLWAMEQYFCMINIEDDATKYAENEARTKLQRLKQRGMVREYVREFSELMLKISDLSENEVFFSFTDGLKPWTKFLNLPSLTRGAMVGTMRKMKRDIAIMATVVVATRIIRNHEIKS